MANAKMRPFGTLAVAASAAALPMVGSAQAADYPVKAEPLAPVWVPHWNFSAEGGLLISNYSRSAFPDGLAPGFADKFGDVFCLWGPPGPCSSQSSGSLAPSRNIGWYGALSIGRDIDPVWDWRLSGSFNSFDTNRRSAAINQAGFEDEDLTGFSVINTSRLVTETDRFRFATLDFDLGRKWEQGLLHLRAFAGFRALATDDTFNISDAEAKGLIGLENDFTSQTNRFTQTDGRSHFVGIGPRIGVEGFYGTTWGVAGSAAAAFLGGWRHSTFDQTSTTSTSLSLLCLPVCVGPFTFNSAQAASVSHSEVAGVGDLTASLGLAWRPTPFVGIEAGYRVEALLNVRDSFSFANTSAISGQFNQKQDVFIQGPYVKALVRY